MRNAPLFSSMDCVVWLRAMLAGCLLAALSGPRSVAQHHGFSWVTPCAPTDNVTGILETRRRSIATDVWGNTYIVSDFLGTTRVGNTTLTTTGRSKLFVAKLNARGEYQWVLRLGGDDEGSAGHGIALDQHGNAYITGYVAGNDIRFGSLLLTNPGNGGFSDVFVAKISPGGQWLWATRAGGTATDYGSAITVDAQGKVYVAGSYHSQIVRFGTVTLPKFGPDTFTTDAFVAQLDAQGRWQWAVQAGGTNHEGIFAIAADRRGNLAVAGRFIGSAAFGNHAIGSGNTFSTGFVASLTTSGRWKWARPLGQAHATVAEAIVCDTARHEWVMGGTAYGPTAVVNGTTITASDAFVARLDTLGTSRWVTQLTGGSSYARALAVDGFGNAHAFGVYSGSVQAGSFPLVSQASAFPFSWGGMFVARLAPNGTWTWATSVNSPYSEAAYGITLDASDNIYLSGSATGYAPNTSAYFHPIVFPLRSNADNAFVAKLPATPDLNDVLLCENGQAELSGPAGALAYQWSTGASTPRISVSQPGIYTVSATLAGGTISRLSFRVRVYVPPSARALGPDTTVCEGAMLRLLVPAYGNMAATYSWSDGSTGSSLVVRQAGVYSVVVSNKCGTYTLTRSVKYEPCGWLSAAYIPNIITPNGDDANDLFVIPGLTHQRTRWALTIYNRWGSKVFETDAYQNNWGHDAAAGVYYYSLREAGTDKTIKGWIEVTR